MLWFFVSDFTEVSVAIRQDIDCEVSSCSVIWRFLSKVHLEGFGGRGKSRVPRSPTGFLLGGGGYSPYWL